MTRHSYVMFLFIIISISFSFLNVTFCISFLIGMYIINFLQSYCKFSNFKKSVNKVGFPLEITC